MTARVNEAGRPVVRTLIVDDDADQRLVLRRLLAAAGVAPVVEAADGDEALEVADRSAPDLVVLDLAMPGRSGLEVLPELRRLAPQASIVMLSNFPQRRFGEAARQLGAVGYVEKRVGPHRLVSEILVAAAITGIAVEVVSAELPSDDTSAAAARRLVREHLDPGDDEVLSSVELLVSELVTNAVLHASSAPRVEVHVSSSSIRVAVHDADPTLPRRRAPDVDALGGRGLQLLDNIASRWHAEAYEDGKVVWFELDRSAG